MINEVELPTGWAQVELNDICHIEMGQSPSSQFYNNNNEGYPLVGGASDFGSQTPESKKHTTDYKKLSSEGDILICIRATIGDLNWSDKTYCLGRGVAGLKAFKNIVPKYIWYSLINAMPYFSANTTGTTFPQVSSITLKKTPLLLPPLNEQNRIVDKIETLFSEVDAGIENLTLAKRQLEQYRQSLLKHAFEGKLTAKWREDYAEKHGKSLPNADELLEQIQAARQNYYDQQIADWEQAVKDWEEQGKEGSKPRKPNALKKLESIADLNEINLPKLPSSWLWERLGLMTLSVEYGTSTKSEKQGLVPVLRMGNMQNGIIDWDDLVFTSDTDEIEKYALKKGDVLFNRTNSPELVGKTSIILSDTKAIFAGYLIRVNQLDSIVYSKYLNYFLGSHIAKQYGNFVKTDGVNQSNINGQKLMNYPFPYCSLDEQVLIVAELDKKIGTADKFKEEIESTIKKLVNLKTSILHKAFQGKLVPQDPNDPPASELLAQIKAEREAKALAEKQAKQDKATSKSKVKTKSAKTPKKPKKDEQITLPL